MTSVEIGSGATARGASRPMSWPICATVFFIGSVILWADRSNFGVAAAVWSKSYGWTKATTGLMLSAFSFGYLIAMPIGGWLTDRLGPRRTLGGCMAGWSLWVLCTPIAPAVIWLTALWRVLLGSFEAPYIPGSSAAVARAVSADTRRGRFGAFVQSGAQLGPAVGVAAAGAILAASGSAAMIFIVFGLLGLAVAALWWLYARNFSDPAPVGAAAQTEEARARAAQAPVPYRKLITSPALWPLYFGYFALPYCQYIFLNWLPIYLTQYRHISLTTASYLSALPYIVAFLAVNFTGWGMDWFAARGWRAGAIHRKLFIGLGAATYVVTVLIAANTASSTLAVTMIIVANAGLSCYVIPFWTICTDMTPTQNGSLSSLMNFCGIIGATLSPFVSGVIADATGAFVAPLELAAAIMVIASITALIFVRVKPLRELVG
ncbi:MAG TPA: MFS transporter [Stellaceae bacterium]|nr:MFS transporter [Stellaceae bacterium]